MSSTRPNKTNQRVTGGFIAPRTGGYSGPKVIGTVKPPTGPSAMHNTPAREKSTIAQDNRDK